MPPPSASQKPAPAPTGGSAPAKKDKGGPSPMLAIIGAALVLFAAGYAAYKIATKPPEKVIITKPRPKA